MAINPHERGLSLYPVGHGKGVDLHPQRIHHNRRDAAAVDRVHRDQPESLQLAEGPRQIRFRAVGEPSEFGDRLRLGVADGAEQAPVIRGQKAQQHFGRLHARLGGVGFKIEQQLVRGRKPVRPAFVVGRAVPVVVRCRRLPVACALWRHQPRRCSVSVT